MPASVTALMFGLFAGPALGAAGNALARWALNRLDDYETAALAEHGVIYPPQVAQATARRRLRAVPGFRIEALGAIVAGLLAFGAAPTGPEVWAMVAGSTIVITALTASDIADHMLPDVLVLGALWAALIAAAVGHSTITPAHAILSAAVGFLLMGGVALGARLALRREGLGQGDVKLVATLGACLGGEAIPALLIIGSTLGIVAALIPGVRGSDGRMAFGPYLLMAGVIWFATPSSVRHALPFSIGF